MDTFINIIGLQKQIDNFQLGPMHLEIEPGTITALVGNNGSGKSTLLKLIMNLAKPDQGSIKVFGISVNEDDEGWKKNIAYQPQTMIGADAFTGETLKALVSRFYPNWDEPLFTEVIQQFDVDLTKKYSKLSQGSQQKLNFALTIARNARVLILDEPTAHMDIPSKKLLIDILVDWMEVEDRSIIIASHQVEDIRKLSDYLFVLHDGHMIGNFEKEELTERYQRYWINDIHTRDDIPGEIARDSNYLISDQPEVTETFLKDHQIECESQTALELDEIITILLTKN